MLEQDTSVTGPATAGRFRVDGARSRLSAVRAAGTAVTASGDNVLKARSKKKKFPSLGRLEKNLEIFHETQKKLDDRYYKSTALVATAATASADNVLKARSKKKFFPSLGRLAKNLEIFRDRADGRPFRRLRRS